MGAHTLTHTCTQHSNINTKIGKFNTNQQQNIKHYIAISEESRTFTLCLSNSVLKKHQLGFRHVRESQSLLSVQAPNKLHEAYEIFLPPVQKLVRTYIQLPGWSSNALSSLFSQSLFKDKLLTQPGTVAPANERQA